MDIPLDQSDMSNSYFCFLISAFCFLFASAQLMVSIRQYRDSLQTAALVSVAASHVSVRIFHFSDVSNGRIGAL